VITPVTDPTALADQPAIRDLVNAYAHHAERRNAHGQAAVFTERTARSG
jgi:hypothetical protein